MLKKFVEYLKCPESGIDLILEKVNSEKNGSIIDGSLRAIDGSCHYPIINGIPRFVPSENYASNYGFEYNINSQIQYDSVSGVSLSEKRFLDVTKWGKNLEGELILEAGCGAGRFTEIVKSTGATIMSFDLSNAVNANFNSHGSLDNILISQADIFAMPFDEETFDRVFCLGVLQHTPNPRKAFSCLVKMVKKGGGRIAIDIFKKTPFTYFHQTKYWVKPITRRLKSETLYLITKRYIDFMWPFANLIRRIPKIGRLINWRLLIADHSHYGFSEEMLKEWSYLDTFDMLSSTYDKPQRINTIKKWFKEEGLIDIEVNYGWNGIEGRGVKG